MDSIFVYCIVDSAGHLFEVCSSIEVASNHLNASCYDVLRESGVSVFYTKRLVNQL